MACIEEQLHIPSKLFRYSRYTSNMLVHWINNLRKTVVLTNYVEKKAKQLIYRIPFLLMALIAEGLHWLSYFPRLGNTYKLTKANRQQGLWEGSNFFFLHSLLFTEIGLFACFLVSWEQLLKTNPTIFSFKVLKQIAFLWLHQTLNWALSKVGDCVQVTQQWPRLCNQEVEITVMPYGLPKPVQQFCLFLTHISIWWKMGKEQKKHT